MRQGDFLRLVDLEGKQAIDFLCYATDDPADRYNAANTIKLNGNIYLGKGSELWSVRARKMMTIVEDTCGSHDTLYGCCSVEIDDVRFGKNNGKGCQGNFEAELAKYGMGEKDVVTNVNLFMYVPVEADGFAGHRTRHLEAGRLCGPLRRDGRARRHLELPGSPQRSRRRRTNAGPRHRLYEIAC